MFGKKKPQKTKPATDGMNTYLTFEVTTHKEAGCPRGCEGDHIRVGVHGCRPNLDNIPYAEWTTPEIMVTSAADYIASKLAVTKTEEKGTLQ